MGAVDKIAEALHDPVFRMLGVTASTSSYVPIAEAVVAAIRAMSPSEQAELIGGRVMSHHMHWGMTTATPTRGTPCDRNCGGRVVGPWTEDAR